MTKPVYRTCKFCGTELDINRMLEDKRIREWGYFCSSACALYHILAVMDDPDAFRRAMSAYRRGRRKYANASRRLA